MDAVKKALGGVFFIAAGVLLAVTKSPDVFTVAAVAACAAIAALSLTGPTVWSAVGGALIISSSLSLQTVLSYRCTDCIKADLLILAGVIYLSIIETSERKNLLRGMASIIAALFMANAWMHYPVFSKKPMAEAAGKVSKYISVSCGGKSTSLDTSVKPLLLYSPGCGECKEVIEKLAHIDPEGKGWVPVQAGGNPEEGGRFLKSAGYRGFECQSDTEWHKAVPALITTREGNTSVVYGREEIIRALNKGVS